MTTPITRPKIRAKEFRFPVEVDWLGGRRVVARVDGKRTVDVMPPPVFAGTDPAAWSPEDFFVAAAATCLAVTFTGLAEREGLEYEGLHVPGEGVAGIREDGRFGFTRLLLRLEIDTGGGDGETARRLAEQAARKCLVAASLDVPVETDVVVS